MTILIFVMAIWVVTYTGLRLFMWYAKRQIANCNQQILVIECEEYLGIVEVDS